MVAVGQVGKYPRGDVPNYPNEEWCLRCPMLVARSGLDCSCLVAWPVPVNGKLHAI